jgi:hypothetical protein
LAALVDNDQVKRLRTVTVLKAIECPQCNEDIKMLDLEKHMSDKHPRVNATGSSKLSRFKSLTDKLMAPRRHAVAANKQQASTSIKSPKVQYARAREAIVESPRK